MPRYFFDVHVNDVLEKDTIGTEFSDLDDACTSALELLPAIAREEMHKDSGYRAVKVDVADEQGHPVYSASLNYAGQRLSP